MASTHQQRDMELAVWIQKLEPMVCYLQETHFTNSQKTGGLSSEWKPQTSCSVCRLQTQNNQRRKEGDCISVKATAHQRDTTIINISTPSNRAPSDIFRKDRFCRSTEKHKLHKGERENLVWAWPQSANVTRLLTTSTPSLLGGKQVINTSL